VPAVERSSAPGQCAMGVYCTKYTHVTSHKSQVQVQVRTCGTLAYRCDEAVKPCQCGVRGSQGADRSQRAVMKPPLAVSSLRLSRPSPQRQRARAPLASFYLALSGHRTAACLSLALSLALVLALSLARSRARSLSRSLALSLALSRSLALSLSFSPRLQAVRALAPISSLAPASKTIHSAAAAGATGAQGEGGHTYRITSISRLARDLYQVYYFFTWPARS